MAFSCVIGRSDLLLSLARTGDRQQLVDQNLAICLQLVFLGGLTYVSFLTPEIGAVIDVLTCIPIPL